MAREKIGSDLTQVRFPDGTFDRIEALGADRPYFIRAAVEAALVEAGGADRVAAAKRSGGKKNSFASSGKKPVSRRSADVSVLLSALRMKSMSSRDLERKVAWSGLRFRNAELRLLDDGLATVKGGLLVAADE